MGSQLKVNVLVSRQFIQIRRLVGHIVGTLLLGRQGGGQWGWLIGLGGS